MKTLILAQDDVQRPTKSALIVGTEVPDQQVVARFYAYKSDGFHPNEWPVLKLIGDKGVVSVSVARFKDAKDKVATLAKEQAAIKAEAAGLAEKDAKRQEKKENKQ